MKVVIPQISQKPPLYRMLHNFTIDHSIIIVLTTLIISYILYVYTTKIFWNKIIIKENINKLYNFYLYLSLFLVFFVSVSIIAYLFILYVLLLWFFVLLYIKWETMTEKTLLNKIKYILEKEIINKRKWKENYIKNIDDIKEKNLETKEWLTNEDKLELESLKKEDPNKFNFKIIKETKNKVNFEKFIIIIVSLFIIIVWLISFIYYFKYH